MYACDLTHYSGTTDLPTDLAADNPDYDSTMAAMLAMLGMLGMGGAATTTGMGVPFSVEFDPMVLLRGDSGSDSDSEGHNYFGDL